MSRRTIVLNKSTARGFSCLLEFAYVIKLLHLRSMARIMLRTPSLLPSYMIALEKLTYREMDRHAVLKIARHGIHLGRRSQDIHLSNSDIHC